MQRRDINAPDAYPPVSAYTQAIEVSGAARTLYISGQIGQRMDGTIPDDIVEQSRLTWQNLEAQLKAVGMTFANLVKVTTILEPWRCRRRSRDAQQGTGRSQADEHPHRRWAFQPGVED
jgi:enamine deaminase RidA (YjgF/YER057c/UK114 family)